MQVWSLDRNDIFELKYNLRIYLNYLYNTTIQVHY